METIEGYPLTTVNYLRLRDGIGVSKNKRRYRVWVTDSHLSRLADVQPEGTVLNTLLGAEKGWKSLMKMGQNSMNPPLKADEITASGRGLSN